MIAEESNGLFILKHNGVLVPNAPKFKQIVAAIAWLDPTGQDHYSYNWATVWGQAEDNIVTTIAEAYGDFAKISKALLELKNNFLIKRIWSEYGQNNSINTQKLREIPGLCFYPGFRNSRGDWKWESDTEPSFRDYENVCSIIGYERIESETQPLFEQLRRRVSQGDILVRTDCPRMSWLLRQSPPFGNLLRHPLLKASAMLTGRLFGHGMMQTKQTARANPYGNI